MGRMWSTQAPWVHSWSNLWVFIAPTFHPGHHQRNSPAEAESTLSLASVSATKHGDGSDWNQGKNQTKRVPLRKLQSCQTTWATIAYEGAKRKKKKPLFWFINKMRIKKLMRTPRSHVRFGELTRSFSIYGICLYVALLTSKLYFYLWGD